jgi:crotonobetaine/carnitine-CoA ligase
MIEMAPVGEVTIREIMDRRARDEPEHIYCYFKNRAYTFGEIDDAVNRVANGLLELGLAAGDRVGLMLPSHPDHIVSIFALAKIGLVRVPVNVHLKGAALDYLFDQFEPRALIVDAAYEEQIRPVLQTRPIESIIWRGASAKNGKTYSDLAGHANNRPPPIAPKTDDILALTPSSGTTGAPKGVLKSDRTLRAGPMGTRALTGMKHGDVFFFWEALHHGAGVAVLIAAVIERITLAMVERFSASQFWAEVRRHQATHIHYLGGVLPMLLKQPANPGDKNHTVRIAWGGGCPLEVWRPFEERFGVQIREGYGLSELITFVMINTDGPVGSVGKPLPYFDVKLIGDDGAEVSAGDTGEIVVRAREPGLQFLGYFRNPEAAAAALRGDWFCTGDIGRMDAHGYFYFAGRKKDSVRRRGVNISAWEVERVINEHEDVEECALIAVPSELGDDELLIYVKKVDGRDLDPRELIRWCEPRMPYFQIPRYVGFVDEFPKTPTQRIRKTDLSRSVDGCWDVEKSGYVVNRKG